MVYNNATDIDVTGIVTADGTGTFSGTTVTQFNTLIGGVSNGITSVGPSSTAGVPLISQGVSANPTYGTAVIAGGGTNAASFTQTDGILTYNGSSLVNYSGPQIDSAGIYTNTSQPAFSAYLAVTAANVTGNGTAYMLGTDALTEDYDVGGNFNTNGTFTAPITGLYIFSIGVIIIGCTICTTLNIFLTTTGITFLMQESRPASASNIAIEGSFMAELTASDTATVSITSSGEAADTNDVFGSFLRSTFFSGYLIS